MLQLVVYVPVTHKELVKQAVFDAGAGQQGDYACCAFEYPGTGQFRPLAGANPFLGASGRLEKVDEVKIEMLCAPALKDAAITALRASHPYEEPAFHFIPVLTE